MKKPFQAVLFDMDGVITDTMPFHYRAWKQIFREAGLLVSKYQIYQREGQRGITSVQEIFAEYDKPFELAEANKMLLRKEELFKKMFFKRFIPGSVPLINLLSKEGIRLGLVTGTSRHEAERVLPKNLKAKFDAMVCGTDVKNGKPHPEPYLKALKLLKMPSKDALVIENAPFGIKAAKAAGLTCLAVETSLPRRYLKEADHVFQNIRSLRRYLKYNHLI